MTDTNHDSPSTPEALFQIHGEPGQRSELFAAMAVAQGAYEPILKTRTVRVRSDKGEYTFDYAPLDEVLRKCAAALAANGLALIQPPTIGEELCVRTLLTHAAGGMIELRTYVPLEKTWWKDGKSYTGRMSLQEIGSAITYVRRYSAVGILGVVAEEDDDGNQADGNQAVVAPRSQARPPAAPPSRPAKPPEAAKPAPKEEPKPAPREEPKPAPKEEPKAAPPAPAPPAEAPPVVHDADGVVLEEVTNPYPSYAEPENKMMATSSTKKNLGDLARAKRLDRASLNELSMKTLGIKAEQLVYEADFQRLLRRIDTGAEAAR